MRSHFAQSAHRAYGGIQADDMATGRTFAIYGDAGGTAPKTARMTGKVDYGRTDGYGAPDGYGAAELNRQQQIRQLVDAGYSRKEAREIVDLDIGGGPAPRVDAGKILEGILDVGGTVADTIGEGLRAGRVNTGTATAAQTALLQQQAALASRQGAAVAPARRTSSMAWVLLGTGVIAGGGLLIYALTRGGGR